MTEIGLTAEEVAARLKVGRSSVYRLLASGELEHHHYPMIGKRVTEEQLARFLAGHVATPAPEPAEPAPERRRRARAARYDAATYS